ncbi:hypothetical protein GYMLUDRAFT_588304 [Collybiopsis luxurians FD-317 M1]|uniref:SH3 domain-containing protein n=1 Tax=Collybiopsis luxurians FD-317 M1 TaxID=944289 RepID=A0A0D0CES7_9AGAR|nr:hypothetical protein GYMLUDRAFT_588304 [Collybiopsis luxurians FD-317 M1]
MAPPLQSIIQLFIQTVTPKGLNLVFGATVSLILLIIFSRRVWLSCLSPRSLDETIVDTESITEIDEESVLPRFLSDTLIDYDKRKTCSNNYEERLLSNVGVGTYGSSSSPQPEAEAMVAASTRQVTVDGADILFYMRALYDYQATTDEEFNFQVGDIIAVTATPEDGWWSGVLLDENRRQPGRHVFPSGLAHLL